MFFLESFLDNLFVLVYCVFIIVQCYFCQGDLGKVGWYVEKMLCQVECYIGIQLISGVMLVLLLVEIVYECQRGDLFEYLLVDWFEFID